MVSYSKPWYVLVASILSAPAATGHVLTFPEDFDMEKWAADLAEKRVGVSSEDFLDGHEFEAPGPGCLRSPCQFINMLANHGFIPRNGRNVKAFDIGKMAEHVYDLPEIGFKTIINAAIYAGQVIVHEEGGEHLLDLDRLWDRPGEERDASMCFPNPAYDWPNDLLLTIDVPVNDEVRYDVTFQEFRKTMSEDLLQNLLARNPGEDFLTLENMGEFFYDRIFDSRKNDPFFLWGDTSRNVAAGQYILPILVFSEGTEEEDYRKASKAQVERLFREERLPDGYAPRTVKYPGFDIIPYGDKRLSFSIEMYPYAYRAEAADLTDPGDEVPLLRGGSGKAVGAAMQAEGWNLVQRDNGSKVVEVTARAEGWNLVL